MTSPLKTDLLLLEQVLESTSDSLWSISIPSMQLEYLNKTGTENLLGYSIDHFYDMDFWRSLVYPPHMELAKLGYSECLKTGSSETRYRIRHANGKYIWILSRRKLIKDENGNPVRMIGSTMDINETVLKEIQLKENEERFKSFLRFVPIGIFITDLEGKSLYVNPAWEYIAGMSDQDALGDNWTNVIHPDDKARVFSEWKICVTQNRIFECDFRFLNKQRGVRFVSNRAAPFSNLAGEHIGYVGTSEDVTDKLLAEKVLTAQRETLVASAKMSSLGEMASGIAHEINNPLMIIVGLCVRLRRLAQDEKMVRDLERIESTTFRISKIIKGLKNFSRNSDKDPMERIPVSKVIEDTLELSKQRFEDNQISLKVELNGFGNCEVLGRPPQLTQVLLNLLSNSFDAVEEHEEKWVKIHLEKTSSDVKIVVSDSGAGISAEIRERMMDPFFTTKEVGKGTGLGLSISKGIIEEHDGKFYFDQSCRHTCFVIQLKVI